MPRPAYRESALVQLASAASCVLLSTAIVACESGRTGTGDRSFVERIEESTPPRTSVARFSVVQHYEPCSNVDIGLRRPASCTTFSGARTEPRHRELAADVARSFDQANDDLVRAAALLDLLWPAGARASILRSIDLLEVVARSPHGDPVVLSDIAAAHLLRAEIGADPRATLAAVDAALQALELAPDLAPARFNLALALEWSGLAHGAREAWLAYLQVDSTSGWAQEARHRAEALAAAITNESTSANDDIDRLAREDAQLLREIVWDTLLASWGEAVADGDTLASKHLLDELREYGQALATQWNDESLLQIHRALSNLTPTDARAGPLASALATHAAARRHYLRGEYDSAGAVWDQLHDAEPPLLDLRQWVSAYRAATLTYRGRIGEAERLVRQLLADTEEREDPALVGRARWILGTTLLRSGRTTDALSMYMDAESAFARAGEYLNVAGSQSQQADARFALGDEVGALRVARRALSTFWSSRSNVWHHNVLFVTAQATARTGLVRASRFIATEDVLIAESLPVGVYEMEARIARASLGRLSGDTAAARRDITLARKRFSTLTIPGAVEWLGANLLLAEAALQVGTHPLAAQARIDSALKLIPAQNAYRRLPALALRAQTLLALDSVEASVRVHRQALAGLDEVSSGVRETTQRLIVLGDIRTVTEELAARLLQDGDTLGALAVLERERSRLGVRSTEQTATAMPRSPPGRTILALSIVQGSVVSWRLSKSTLVATRVPGSSASIIGAIDEVNSRLSLSLAGPRTDSLLEHLHERLIQSVVPSLEGVTQLVIVADGEIANAPFAALRDRRTGRYLIQDIELWFAPSIRASAVARRARQPGPKAVTAIGVSALDRSQYPSLTPLRHAERESKTIASLYEEGRVIVGPSATPSRVIEVLGESRVVHVAAHAVSNAADPLASHIVLVGEPGRGRLPASRIAMLELGGLDLVVLASCETQRGSEGRAGGLAGLTWSFLRAGAGGVVGSTWRVDDEATSALMTGMHERYANGDSAPAALRAAQLAMFESTEQRWKSPTYWAAFRYATATVH
jgi:CHAT domain-containing protein/tetratricopeptide (TPR) repeat protein